MQNQIIEIRRELVLNAPIEKVWDAVSNPESWTAWFSYAVEGRFAPGEVVRLDMGSDFFCSAEILEMEAPRRMVYRWHPGEDCAIDAYPAEEMTTVTFTMEPVGDQTRFTVVETGFERIPEPRREKAVRLNNQGWTPVLADLTKWVEQGVRQVRKANAG
ncbi:MAG: SRPBCC domain-containing protein [Fimbriimonadaceae bacterium]